MVENTHTPPSPTRRRDLLINKVNRGGRGGRGGGGYLFTSVPTMQVEPMSRVRCSETVAVGPIYSLAYLRCSWTDESG